jgi:hypothetical protein
MPGSDPANRVSAPQRSSRGWRFKLCRNSGSSSGASAGRVAGRCGPNVFHSNAVTPATPIAAIRYCTAATSSTSPMSLVARREAGELAAPEYHPAFLRAARSDERSSGAGVVSEASSARTSASRNRRCPPGVRIEPIRPAEAHRVTVFGSTRNSAATSPGVSKRSVFCGWDMTKPPLARRLTVRTYRSIVTGRPLGTRTVL